MNYMDMHTFWNIIDQVNEEVPYEENNEYQYYEKYIEHLKIKLKEFDFTNIVKFQEIMDEYKSYLYRYDVWYECAWLLQHSSDDGFEYFLRWIVSRGKDFYFSVCDDIRNIEKLDWRFGYRSFEEFGNACHECLEEEYQYVLDAIGDCIYGINVLTVYEKNNIKKEVEEAFSNGVNPDVCEKNKIYNMWLDENLRSKWDECVAGDGK